jgi:hypothetical protein
MKSRFWTAVLYILAVFVILARIENAIEHGFWIGALKLYLPVSPELIGADLESLGEDLIVFLAIRDIVLFFRGRKASASATR